MFAIVALTSCSSSKSTTSTKISEQFSNVKVAGLTTDMLMADVEVGKTKVTGTYTIEDAPYQKNRNVNLERMLNNAIFDALQTVEADAIVGLQYKFNSEYDNLSNVHKRTIVITGYPAWYRNFRPVPEDKNEFEIKELKSETPYVIIEKDSKTGGKGYRVVSTTKIRQENVIPLENVSLERVELNKKEKQSKK